MENKIVLFVACLSIILDTRFVAAAGDVRYFDCTGQVVCVCGGVPKMVLTASGPDIDNTLWLDEKLDKPPKSGDIVHFQGTLERPTGRIKDEMPDVDAHVVRKFKVLEHKEFTTRTTAPAYMINNGEQIPQPVSISGVASSVVQDEMNDLWNWFILRTRDGNVYVATPDYEHPIEELRKLTDAEVEITGRVLAQNRWRRFSGQHLLPLGKNGIKVLRPPPSLGEIRKLSPQDLAAMQKETSKLIHRVRTDGVLVAAGRKTCFVETPRGDLVRVIPSCASPVPECGSYVTALGFAVMRVDGMQLSDGFLMESGTTEPFEISKAVETDIAELFREIKNPGVRAPSSLRRRVRITSVAANSVESIVEGRSIRIKQGAYSVDIDVSGICGARLDQISMGSLIQVTGVCNAEFETDPSVATFPRFTGFSITPMSAEDIVVVRNPPWWNTRRLTVLVLALLGALAAISALSVMLKAMSDRRGRQLYDERVAHVRTEAKVEERTRLAVELHDAISQTLTGVALQVDSAAMANGDEGNAVGAFLRTARNMLASCRRELKDCLWDLRSRTFEEKDMTEAIIRTIGPHKGDATASVRFNVPRERLSESTTHTILSIVRELVVNAIRHGRATHVWIAGEYHDGRITFSVRDNGCGFDAASAPGPRDGHFGLQGVRERVKEAGGTVEIVSAPEKGTKVTIAIVPKSQMQTFAFMALVSFVTIAICEQYGTLL